MKKIVYIASLNTKNDRYDGERIKSTLIYESLNKCSNIVNLVNLSKNKLFSTLKLLLISIFKKREIDYFVISKDPRGAKIIEKILNFCGIKNQKRIYFEIGPFLYDMLLKNKVKPYLFSSNKNIIVETKSMKEELEQFGFKNVSIFPNFKHRPTVNLEEKHYPQQVIKLVYFSRIEEKKGIYELIDCIKIVNQQKQKYQLDIYGMFMRKSDEHKLLGEISGRSDIAYKGKLDMDQSNSYIILSKYDLHVFPTWYDEGFPGSLIDFFFVGVPTLSSSFLRSKDILSSANSFIYNQKDKMDLIEKLNFIYDNQHTISEKAIKTLELANLYTSESFDTFVEELLNE